MQSIAPDHIRQHRCVYNAWRRGHITDALFVETFLRQTTDLSGLELVEATPAAPNPIASVAPKYGIGAHGRGGRIADAHGWAHITTSSIDFMGWHETAHPVLGPGEWEFLTVDWYTCGPIPPWFEMVAHADEFFGVDGSDPRCRAWSLVLPELGEGVLLGGAR